MNENTIRIFNTGRRVFMRVPSYDGHPVDLEPQQALDVHESIGKRYLKAYPRELKDASQLTSNRGADPRDKRIKELEEQVARLEAELAGAPVEPPEDDGLNAMTKAQLREHAAERDIDLPEQANKAELLVAIRGA